MKKTRKQAFRDAKRDAKISMMSQPIKIEHVFLKEAMYKGGHAIKDDKGNLIKTREYHFYNSTGEKIIIQEHSAGHKKGNQPAHFHIRPENNTRTGKILGTKKHYYFDVTNTYKNKLYH